LYCIMLGYRVKTTRRVDNTWRRVLPQHPDDKNVISRSPTWRPVREATTGYFLHANFYELYYYYYYYRHFCQDLELIRPPTTPISIMNMTMTTTTDDNKAGGAEW